MNPARRNLLLSAPLLLTGCGFALRQAPRFGFRSIYLALPDSSALGLELRRQLQGTGNVQVIADAAQRDKAEVVLESPGEQRERAVVSVTARGEVREFQLRIRFRFRLRAADGRCGSATIAQAPAAATSSTASDRPIQVRMRMRGA